MSPSFDCLLCGEDNRSILEDDENEFYHQGFGWQSVNSNRNHGFTNNSSNNGSSVVESFPDKLPLLSEECLSLLVEKETQHMPCVGYLVRLRNGELDLTARMQVLDWILKAHAHFGFGPLSAYLSVSYLDRFLSAYEIPKDKVWMMQLLAVACLSLAAKMDETEIPLCLDLQVGESRFLFEGKTIQRMELLVLSTLRWRMQAVTPFSFTDYFLSKLNGDQTPPTASVSRSTQLILSTMKGIDFLEFRPSEVAASVVIASAKETQTVDIEKSLSVISQHVSKDRVVKCIELLNDLGVISGSTSKDGPPSGSVTSLPQSPIGVLDAACLSYKSDDTRAGSYANSTNTSPDHKRRRLQKSCDVEL